MGKIFINISKGYKMFDYYTEIYKDFYEKQGIQTLVLFDGRFSNGKNEIGKDGSIKIDFYFSREELFQKIESIKKEDIFYINTFEETLVPLVHEIRVKIGFPVSDKYQAFRDKYLQRKYLYEKYPDITVKYCEIDIFHDDIESFCHRLDFPYIIKPTGGVQSSGVTLIHSREELQKYIGSVQALCDQMHQRGILETKFLIEEYIDGDMYTIVYFVNHEGKVFYSPVVKVNGAEKIGIDDFFNYVRISGKVIDNEIDFQEVKQFVLKHVEVFGIRNTFIFQDFKKNSKGELKNIELNARIGGYRLEMMKENYHFNLLDMILGKEINGNQEQSNAVFVFYPKERGILKGFDKKWLQSIGDLNSVYNIRTLEKKIGKEIGPTKEGFSNVAVIRLRNKDLATFMLDFQWIESHYNELIELR